MNEFFLTDHDLAIGTVLPIELWPMPAPDPTPEPAAAPSCPPVPGYSLIGEFVDADGDCWCVRRCEGGGIWWKRCGS